MNKQVTIKQTHFTNNKVPHQGREYTNVDENIDNTYLTVDLISPFVPWF